MRRSIRWRQYCFAAGRSARESDRGCEIHRRHPSWRTARRHHPALAACACADRRTRPRPGARDAGGGRGDLAARRRPRGALCRPADRGRRRTGSPAPWKQNVRGPSSAFSHKAKKARSWMETAREARNPWLVEETFRTGTQQHSSLEPHPTVARFDGDRLTVHVSTQAVFHVMELLAKRYKLGHDKIRVIADHVGGGFGSKGALGIETTAAIDLAREARAPVRIAYDRHEELSVTGYRPAAEVKIALLPSEQGDLKALSLTAYGDTGAAVNSTIATLARLIYPAQA